MNYSRTKEHLAKYADQDYNPYLPTHPGVPGVLFKGLHDVLEYRNWRLFRKSDIWPENRTVYNYIDQYNPFYLGDLTHGVQ